VPVGGIVDVNGGPTTGAAFYEGYYLNNGVEDPLLYDGGSYVLLGDSRDLSSYTIVAASYTACFVGGTHIRTARGDVPVEALVVGDLVVTTSGDHRPIRWLGHRTINCRLHSDSARVMPVRIAAHAMGVNRPARDLSVSPGHAICITVVDEVLMPASALINDTTIAQLDVEEVTYWHVELDSHDIILAENLPTESYLEMGNRSFFIESGVTAIGAVPDAPTEASGATHADFCRPFHAAGSLVEVVKQQIRARSLLLGWTLREAPLGDLHLLVDGVRVEPVARGLSVRFTVPAGAEDVWLVSNTSRPVNVTGAPDHRDLGVCLAALSIDDGFAGPAAIDLADPLLCVGFHRLEDGDRRWTTGRARLPTALWADHRDGCFLRADLALPALPQWVAPPAKSRAVTVGSDASDVTMPLMAAC
jgi:hypothetical protein